jgi:methyltransferase (TIGR00027 family)
MLEGQFSRTAIGAAGHRAAHQVLDAASLFVDPFATRILGKDLDSAIADGGDPARRRLRLFIALRSRIAEDAARGAIGGGIRQIVVLGAGLDTFGYRVAPAEGLRIFEVDHPATQAEKRRRLAEAEIPVPLHLVYAPCDFETRSLGEAVEDASFDPHAAAFFIWLGVTPYLTSEAVGATLGYVGGLAGGAEIVFDYVNPPDNAEAQETRARHERMAARVAALGEPFRGYFETADLHRRLAALGFNDIDDWGPRRIRERLAPNSPRIGDNGGHILRAARRA